MRETGIGVAVIAARMPATFARAQILAEFLGFHLGGRALQNGQH